MPRRINNLCDRILLFAFLEDVTTIDADVVDSVSRELGGEFWSGNPAPATVGEPVQEVFNTPGQPLETMARVMFDKANVQQRIGSLERALDSMGSGLKNDISEVKDEIAYLRLLLEDVLHEIRSASGQSDLDLDPGAEITFPYKQGSSEIP